MWFLGGLVERVTGYKIPVNYTLLNISFSVFVLPDERAGGRAEKVWV